MTVVGILIVVLVLAAVALAFLLLVATREGDDEVGDPLEPEVSLDELSRRRENPRWDPRWEDSGFKAV